MFWLIAGILWFLAAWSVAKLDAVLTGNPTDKYYVIVSLILWPFCAVYLVTCKHHIDNNMNDYWDY